MSWIVNRLNIPDLPNQCIVKMLRIPYTATLGDLATQTYELPDLFEKLTEFKQLIYGVGQLEETDKGFLHWQFTLLMTEDIDTKTMREHLYGPRHKVNIYLKKSLYMNSILYCIKRKTRQLGPYEFYKKSEGEKTAWFCVWISPERLNPPRKFTNFERTNSLNEYFDIP